MVRTARRMPPCAHSAALTASRQGSKRSRQSRSERGRPVNALNLLSASAGLASSGFGAGGLASGGAPGPCGNRGIAFCHTTYKKVALIYFTHAAQHRRQVCHISLCKASTSRVQGSAAM